jgi:hypothetical protein
MGLDFFLLLRHPLLQFFLIGTATGECHGRST